MEYTSRREDRDTFGETLKMECRICGQITEPKFGVAKCRACGSWNVKIHGKPLDKNLDTAGLCATIETEMGYMTNSLSQWEDGWKVMADHIITCLQRGGDIREIIQTAQATVSYSGLDEEQLGRADCLDWIEGELEKGEK